MNTRRYPRTLNEAFPNTPEYACAIERPFDWQARVIRWAVVVTAVLSLLVALS